MIGLITKNNLYRTTLSEILSDLIVVPYQPDQVFEAVLTTESDIPTDIRYPIITLGVTLPNDDLHLDIPIQPRILAKKVKAFCAQIQPTFENSFFLFQKSKRCLIAKGSNITITLTEKENDLLTALADAAPNSLSKEALLTSVWNYKPDIETHTVESHIHALRKKIGENADSLIKSTPSGYLLSGD